MTFPKFLDSTMVEVYKRCPQEFFLSFIQNLKPIEKNWHFHAGGAMARGLETARKAWVEGKPDWQERGLEALILAYGEEDSPIPAKSFDRLVEAYTKYWLQWPIDQGLVLGPNPMVEFTFSLPMDIEHPETKEPIIYCGRCDWIGHLNGSAYVVDEKTTSSLGPTWSSRWSARGQFLGYVHAARCHGIEVAGYVVRGIALTTEPTYAESIHLALPYKVHAWWQDLHHWVRQMIEAWRNKTFLRHYGNECGSCAFNPICHALVPTNYLAYFEQRNWDPLRKEEQNA